jgi:hypothetical protein
MTQSCSSWDVGGGRETKFEMYRTRSQSGKFFQRSDVKIYDTGRFFLSKIQSVMQ